MNRIFPVLVVLALSVLAAASVAGYLVDSTALHGPASETTPERAGPSTQPRDAAVRMFRLHFLLGISASLVVMFVHGIIVTYFIGTSRWCKEVVIAYSLDKGYVTRSGRVKRRVFPFTVAAMLTAVAIVALGAAADPATHVAPLWEGLPWSQVHLAVVLGGIALMLLVHFVQWTAIVENQQIIAELTEKVRAVRKEKGLEA
jgi:hypothetical protein